MAVAEPKVQEKEVSEMDDLFPISDTIEVGDTVYKVTPFKLGKAALMLEFVTELLNKADFSTLFEGLSTEQVVKELVNQLPTLTKEGRPVLFRALALTLMPDKRLREIDLEGGDVRAEIDKFGKDLSYDIDPTQAIDILAIGIKSIGIEAMRRNLPKLSKALQ